MSSARDTNRRRDLQDLRDLSRLPILSYLQKQAAPRAPRIKTAELAPASYPLLAAFSPQRMSTWAWEYLRIASGHAIHF
jgi:hypothetical protein